MAILDALRNVRSKISEQFFSHIADEERKKRKKQGATEALQSFTQPKRSILPALNTYVAQNNIRAVPGKTVQQVFEAQPMKPLPSPKRNFEVARDRIATNIRKTAQNLPQLTDTPEERQRKITESALNFSPIGLTTSATGPLKSAAAKIASTKNVRVIDKVLRGVGITNVKLTKQLKNVDNADEVMKSIQAAQKVKTVGKGGQTARPLEESFQRLKQGDPAEQLKKTDRKITGPILPDPSLAATNQMGAISSRSNRQLGQEVGSKMPTRPKKLSTSSSITVSQPSDFYNLDRLKIDDKAKQAIQKEINGSRQILERSVGRRLTNKEVIATADKTAQIMTKGVGREQTEAKIAANLNLRRKIAEAAQNGKVDEDFVRAWITDKSVGEDIARQLQARRITADPGEAPLYNAILEGIYRQNKNADEIAKAAKGVDFNDAKQVTEFYRKFVKAKVLSTETLDILRYNSMLSSPNTHLVNVASNFQGTGIIAPVEKTLTGMIDAAKSAITGSKREYFAGEGAAYAKGYYSNVKKAATAFTDTLRGKNLVLQPDVRSIPLTTGGPARAVENVFTFPMRMLEASDRFFSALTEGGSEAALKYKVSKGLKIDNLGEKAAQEASERLFRAETNLPQQGNILEAMDFFTNKITEARSSDNILVSTISKFTLPFVRTPTNIIKQGIEYSPLGASTLWGATNKTEQVSKAVLGSSAALGVATLLGTDRLTWAEPTNENRKNSFRASGMQPYSVKIGNKWISYSKLHPSLAFNFALVAAVDDALKEKKIGEETADVILSSFAKYANFIADQSYVKNIGDFVAGAKGDVYGFSKYLANYPTQLIPFRALGSWINRIVDPVQRQADKDGSVLDKQMQQIMMQIPGFAQKVPARLDSEGNPIKNQNPLLNAFSPVRISTEQPEAANTYRKMQNLSKVEQEEKYRTQQIKDKALVIFNDLKDLPKEQRVQALNELKASGELTQEMYEAYMIHRRAVDMNLSGYEKSLLSADTDARARVIFDEIKGLPKEQRLKILNDYKRKKILSEDTYKKYLKLKEAAGLQ